MPAELAKPQYDASPLMHPENCRLRFVTITIPAGFLTEKNPTFRVDSGILGVGRVFNIDPQPLGENFAVAWDGNTENPTLRFDLWPEGEVRVRMRVDGR